LLGFGYQKAVMVAALPHNRKTKVEGVYDSL
jgi:hypothetical protein